MKKSWFSPGLLLSLAGLIVVIVGGILKPPTGTPWAQWKNASAPSNLLWMVGLPMCVAGIILILRDIFRN